MNTPGGADIEKMAKSLFAGILVIVLLSGLFVVIVPSKLTTFVLLAGVAALLVWVVSHMRHLWVRTKLPEKTNLAISERERMITLINNLADAVICVDEKGCITLFNAATLNILDTNKALDGASLNDVFTLTDDNGKKVRLFTRIKKAKSVTHDDTLRMKQGDEELRLDFTYAPIRSGFSGTDNQSEGYVLIARDITRLKSLEEERDEFISVVSHELRTPVTVAEGTISNAQLLLERGTYDTAMLEKSLEEAHNQVLYLARMVNDLSTLSRAERGVAAERESINVDEMAHQLIKEYSPEAESKGLHLNLDISTKLGTVMTSRLYLHELLQNFITNGIKYTKEGSITLKITRSKDNILHFSVSDTGIGISTSDQARVFDKFFRSEDYRTRETGGTGLGLYVSAKLSRKLNTSIALKSRLNHGSTFSFDLPAER